MRGTFGIACAVERSWNRMCSEGPADSLSTSAMMLASSLANLLKANRQLTYKGLCHSKSCPMSSLLRCLHGCQRFAMWMHNHDKMRGHKNTSCIQCQNQLSNSVQEGTPHQFPWQGRVRAWAICGNEMASTEFIKAPACVASDDGHVTLAACTDTWRSLQVQNTSEVI